MTAVRARYDPANHSSEIHALDLNNRHVIQASMTMVVADNKLDRASQACPWRRRLPCAANASGLCNTSIRFTCAATVLQRDVHNWVWWGPSCHLSQFVRNHDAVMRSRVSYVAAGTASPDSAQDAMSSESSRIEHEVHSCRSDCKAGNSLEYTQNSVCRTKELKKESHLQGLRLVMVSHFAVHT
jgi:hypothetical protein